MGSVLMVLELAVVVGVGVDASRLGVRRGCRGGGFLDMGVVAWILCCLIFWVVGLIAYLVARPRYVQLRRLHPVGELPDLRAGAQLTGGATGAWATVPVAPGYGAAPAANPYAAPAANPYAAPAANPYAAPGQRACQMCGTPGTGAFCSRCGTAMP